MSIKVNDIEITDNDVALELPHHTSAPNPTQAAAEALVLRQVLLDASRQANFLTANTAEVDAAIERLLAQEVIAPTPTEAECRRYYAQHLERFRSGDLVEASHILFQITETTPLDALRAKAQEVLRQVLDDPASFSQCARDFSNCPSGEMGGNLGQLTRSQSVPEFEHAIFALPSETTSQYLVETRFGLHIVRVDRKIEGEQLPFELVQDSIARFLTAYAESKATRQYLEVLVGQADIQGIKLHGADSPMVQ